MTNAQLLLSVGIPSLTVLVGILINNKSLSEFKADVTKRLDRLELDLREFYRISGKLEAKVEVLERKG